MEKNTRPTRSDVARLAGVSTTTVSNVINHKKNVGDTVKNRVLQAMEELNYRPNLIARSLITSRSKHLAVVIEDLADLHHSAIIDAFRLEAEQEGYFVSICVCGNNLATLFDSFISRGIDGVFAMISPSEQKNGGIDATMELFRQLTENNIKVLLGFNCREDLEHFSSLEADFGGAVGQAVDYLVSLGHRRIGLLNIFDQSYPFDSRYRRFVEAMQRHGVAEPAAVLGKPPYPGHIETGEAYAERLLEQYPDITAIIGTNDMISLGALSYLGRHGYRVPEDISVVSLGDVAMLQYFQPYLTAVSLNFADYGKTAFEIIRNSLESNSNYGVLHKMKLTVRDTTGPAGRSITEVQNIGL